MDNFPEIIYSIAMILRLWDDLGTRFKKSTESGTTRSVHNRLRANCVNSDTGYETICGSVKTRHSSRDDSIDSMKIQRIESPRYEEQKNLKQNFKLS